MIITVAMNRILMMGKDVDEGRVLIKNDDVDVHDYECESNDVMRCGGNEVADVDCSCCC